MHTMNAGTKTIRVAIITLSDRASAGIYKDLSAPLIEQYLDEHYKQKPIILEKERYLLPDNANQLRNLLTDLRSKTDLIITTGGTGIGPSDHTPDVVKELLSREIPGIMELIRVKYGMQNPAAALSRSVAGMMEQCFVFTLPGSPKAVHEYMSEILLNIDHLFRMRNGSDQH